MAEIVRRMRPELRNLTSARVALPTTGNSIATEEVLNFQLAHAQARDAVHSRLDVEALARRLAEELGSEMPGVITLRSNAADRASYLRHPQLGRTLRAEDAGKLAGGDYDLAIVLADGLSATAVERHAAPLLAALLPGLADAGWKIAPFAIVEQGRVAVGDAVGSALGARCSLVLIGERPGLSTPSSLGAYLTWSPQPGRSDADRNCLSNIHEAGLSYGAAAARLRWYLDAARAAQRTGVLLKEGAQEDMTLPPNSVSV